MMPFSATEMDGYGLEAVKIAFLSENASGNPEVMVFDQPVILRLHIVIFSVFQNFLAGSFISVEIV